MEAYSATREKRRPYPGSTIAVAAIATVFFPLISLIVALVLHAGQPDPAKREMLRNWAIAAGAWLVAAFLIGFVVFAVGSGGGVGVDESGPCVGGPVMGASGRDVSGNGTKFVIPCAVSGTVTITTPIDH